MISQKRVDNEKCLLRTIERHLYENITFVNDSSIFDRYEVGTDSKYRVSGFYGMGKAEMERMLHYLDQMVITTVQDYELEIIDCKKFKCEMFLHCSMLMSIIDTCKNYGWNITSNWRVR